MIEKYLSVQDVIGIGLVVGTLIKAVQILYFDKLNKGGKK